MDGPENIVLSETDVYCMLPSKDLEGLGIVELIDKHVGCQGIGITGHGKLLLTGYRALLGEMKFLDVHGGDVYPTI